MQYDVYSYYFKTYENKMYSYCQTLINSKTPAFKDIQQPVLFIMYYFSQRLARNTLVVLIHM